ncbi:conserved hypothetical protein [uncultured Paludibacter sp.]|nr:conserved hypothetical protein [uncultured Paludibacter sp.]
MKIFIIILVVVLLLLVFFSWYAKRKMKNISNVAPHEKIVTLSDANFNHQLKGKTILVDFWAEWCMPCKMMAPILNDLAADLPDGYFVGKLDVDKNQAMAHNFNVRSIPTLILYKNGKEVNRFVGVKTKDFLKKEMMK